eukprot:s81_g17.t1
MASSGDPFIKGDGDAPEPALGPKIPEELKGFGKKGLKGKSKFHGEKGGGKPAGPGKGPQGPASTSAQELGAGCKASSPAKGTMPKGAKGKEGGTKKGLENGEKGEGTSPEKGKKGAQKGQKGVETNAVKGEKGFEKGAGKKGEDQGNEKHTETEKAENEEGAAKGADAGKGAVELGSGGKGPVAASATTGKGEEKDASLRIEQTEKGMEKGKEKGGKKGTEKGEDTENNQKGKKSAVKGKEKGAEMENKGKKGTEKGKEKGAEMEGKKGHEKGTEMENKGKKGKGTAMESKGKKGKGAEMEIKGKKGAEKGSEIEKGNEKGNQKGRLYLPGTSPASIAKQKGKGAGGPPVPAAPNVGETPGPASPSPVTSTGTTSTGMDSSSTPSTSAEAQSRKRSKAKFVEKPLDELEALYDKDWLQEKVDPTNDAKRIYKVFHSIEDTREEEECTGTALRGRAKVPGNKAVRSTLEGALTTKAASTRSADSLDLFGGLEATANEKAKAKAKAKQNPNKKVKKEITPEEKLKKSFNTDLEKPLVFKPGPFLSDHVRCICSCAVVLALRLQALANKARATATRLTDTGILHQEAMLSLQKECASWQDADKAIKDAESVVLGIQAEKRASEKKAKANAVKKEEEVKEHVDSTRRLQDGRHRDVTQQLLLPHEIVDAFIREGVTDRASRKLFTGAVLQPSRNKYTDISQKVLSATACRYCIFWLNSVVQGMGSNDEVSLCFDVPWRCGLTGALASMESLCLRSGRWMSLEVCSEMKRNYLVLRTCLNLLARRAFDERVLRYHIRPKLHFLGHLIYHFLPRNPRHMACYLDEDFISRTKRLAERCHPLYMSQQVTFRYAVHLCLKLSGKIG